jgi:hypothetical protein
MLLAQNAQNTQNAMYIVCAPQDRTYVQNVVSTEYRAAAPWVRRPVLESHPKQPRDQVRCFTNDQDLRAYLDELNDDGTDHQP